MHMAFVPGCQHDIFVSYAHVDDRPLPGAEQGWVTTLTEGLRTQLATHLGRIDAFSLWRDPHLARNESFSSQLDETLRHSAILLVILSPGYVASQWCLREKDTFLRAVREKPRGSSRVFLVERHQVEPDERPQEFVELLGFRFWVVEREGMAPRILGTPRPEPDEKGYWDTLNDLSFKLAKELKALRQASSGPQSPGERPGSELQATVGRPGTETSARPAVYLAHVTDDLDPVREDVGRYLDQAGLRVLPEKYYSFDLEAFRHSLREDLAQVEIFVQLLSEVPGKRPPALPQGYSALQLDEAVAAGKRIVQWRRPELDPSTVADAQQQGLLSGEKVMAVGLEELKREIKQRVLQPPAAAKPPINAFVFVNMEGADRVIAEEICELLDGHGVDFALPLSSGDPSAIRTDLEQNLMDCDALILIYGSTTATWVREQLRQCRKALGNRERPLRAIAVYEGPPGQKDPLDLKLRNMRILDGREHLERAALESFLAELEEEASA